MRNKIESFLIAIKLMDDDKTVSLSSALVILAGIRLMAGPYIGPWDVAVLTLILVNYNARKAWRDRQRVTSDETLSAMNNLNQKIDAVQGQVKQMQNVDSLAGILNQFNQP